MKQSEHLTQQFLVSIKGYWKKKERKKKKEQYGQVDWGRHLIDAL